MSAARSLPLRRQTGQVERVLMTTDTLGGVWAYALELCRGLAGGGVGGGAGRRAGSQGIELTLAAMGGEPSRSQRAEAAAVPGLRLEVRPYKLEWMPDPWDDVDRAGEWLLELEDEFEPDLIHLNDYSHGALPWRHPVLMVGHSCVCSWFEAVKGHPAPPRWWRYRERVTAGLESADAVVAPSAAMLGALQHHYGPLPGARSITNARRAQDWPVGAKQPVVLGAGRIWDDAKNLAALARVAPRLVWPVRIAGRARHPAAAPDDRPLKLPHVEMLGRLDPAALAQQMGCASIYVLPARYEPFGLTVLEAALAGCALVLGDIPSFRELWGDTALYVDPDDDKQLLAAIQSLTRAPQRRADLVSRSRRRARRYSPGTMVDEYLEIYRHLCGAQKEAKRCVSRCSTTR